MEYHQRRMLMEASNGDIESIRPSTIQERTYHSYKKLVLWCPSVSKELTRMNLPATPHKVILACQDLEKGADAARADDGNRLKTSVARWLNEKEAPVFVPGEKQGRGFNHEVTGRLLCPVDYNWSNTVTCSAIRDHSDRSYTITAHIWSTFLYSNGAYNKYHPSDGLFKGELLVRAFQCIFTSPSLAQANMELHNHTRCNVAGLLKMQSVQPRAIAYTAIQVRFALSSQTAWGLVDLDDLEFNYETFYNNIIDWFECAHSQAKAQEIEDLLLWWNR